MPLVAGVDSSTQSTKVQVRDLHSGEIVAESSAPHTSTNPPRSEQDPEEWWQALLQALSAVSECLGDVVSISVAAQQHGLVVLDSDCRVIRPAKLWNDTESAPEARALTESLGADGWARACGSVPVPAFTITKLAWLAAHEPDAFSRVSRVMLPHDYLTWRLTDAFVTDRGDASGTGWWDPASETYRLDLLELVAKRDDWLDLLPHVLGPTEAAGEIAPGEAASTGLRNQTLVGPGTGDNMAAALGLGLRPGDAVISLGTSGTAYAVSSQPANDSSGAVAGFADASGRYLPLVCTLNATKVTDTVAQWLGMSREEFAAEAMSATPGSGGVVLVPYFDGERTPNLPDATGSWSGLRNSTSRADLARSAHEGVVCSMLDALDKLKDAGARADRRLYLIGGGSKSEAYRHITADLHGRSVIVPRATETVAAGACVQAAWMAGHQIGEIAGEWGLGEGEIVEPSLSSGACEIRSTYRAVLP